MNGMLTQVAQAVKMRGTTMTLRRANSTGGPNPLPMPPVCENPVVASLTPVGATSISISAAAANGALVQGDEMIINGVTYTVGAEVLSTGASAASPGFVGVPVTPAVASAIAAGTPIAFDFSLDQTIYATVNSYAQELIDGTLIQSSDLMFTLAAWDLVAGAPLSAPNQSDQIIFAGTQFGIVSTNPVYALGTVVKYAIQARA
jgi:hypothetical protein